MEKSVALYFKNQNSDKEYHVYLEHLGRPGWAVNYAYGRRGTALHTGTKTQTPVPFSVAEKIYDKLVILKRAKGYTESSDGRVFAMSKNAGRITENIPQLLNTVSEEECNSLIKNDLFAMQQKKNGDRVMITKSNGIIEGSNKKGLVISLPKEVEDSLARCPNCKLDGEMVGATYWVFDALDIMGDLSKLGYKQRYQRLTSLTFGSNVIRVPLHIGSISKESAYLRFKKDNKEGVVFKKLDARYTPGRPNSGGDQLKFKFVETCSAVVSHINEQRSVGMELDGTFVGNVTILPNFEIPKKGNVIEVRYLYAHEGGALVQPVYLGIRNDVDINECKLSQLKYKGE